jgi:hypothetical protein
MHKKPELSAVKGGSYISWIILALLITFQNTILFPKKGVLYLQRIYYTLPSKYAFLTVVWNCRVIWVQKITEFYKQIGWNSADYYRIRFPLWTVTINWLFCSLLRTILVCVLIFCIPTSETNLSIKMSFHSMRKEGSSNLIFQISLWRYKKDIVSNNEMPFCMLSKIGDLKYEVLLKMIVLVSEPSRAHFHCDSC